MGRRDCSALRDRTKSWSEAEASAGAEDTELLREMHAHLCMKTHNIFN